MANANTTASNTRTSTKGRRGPRPIVTVAELKANLLRDALAREVKKIDRKLATETRKRKIANDRANAANSAIAELERIRADFLRESGIKA